MEDGEGGGSAEVLFVEDLRALGSLYRDVLGRQPSARVLARAIGVSPTTVGKWLEGAQVPQQPDRLTAAVQLLRVEAERRGLLNAESSRLLDSNFWSTRHRAVLEERASFTGKLIERSNAESEIFRQSQHAELIDLPRPIGDWLPAQLGVHPAIAGLGALVRDFVLPRYILRTHDEFLRGQLCSIAAGRNVELVLLRGESCTGKTRSAYEAINACLPDWRLIFPKDSASLTAALAAGATGPKTVLWLNEAQNYLYGPEGESCAAALRRRLEGVGPMAVVLTLWPEHHRILTSTDPSLTGASTHVKALLAQASLHIVPSRLDGEELAGLQRSVGSDASLAAAHQASGKTGKVVQILAAGPDLVDYYEHPIGRYGCYGKAFITAAMDARRLGVTAPLGLDFLVAAAPGYLDDAQRAEAPDDWAENAVAYARRPVKNVTSAFCPVAKEKGIGPQPGVVELADYLNQYGRKKRSLLCPPNSFWEAAVSLISRTGDLEKLATSAMNRLRISHGTALAEKAAALGDSEALWELAFQNFEVENYEESERILRRLAASGQPDALVSLAADMEDIGRIEEARKLYTEAADLGYFDELRNWADTEAINDRQDSAIWIYRLLIAKGDEFSFFGLATLLESGGEFDEAADLYERGLESGHVKSAHALAHLRETQGRVLDADKIRLGVVPTDDEETLMELMLSYESTGKTGVSESLYWQLLEAGDEGRAVFLPWNRAAAGDLAGAERIAIAAAERGFLLSLDHVIVQCMRNGDDREASRLLRHLTEMGGSLAPSLDLALYFERMGESGEAEIIAAGVDDRLDGYVLLELAKYRAKRGDMTSARNLARRLLNEGDAMALSYLAAFEEEDGNQEEAERLARLAVDAGDFRALKKFADRNPDIRRILRNGL